MTLFEHPLNLFRNPCKSTAFHRLHHDHILPVLYRSLITFMRLDSVILPVKIIDLQQYKLHLRMVGKDAVNHLRIVVTGESNVFYQALLLLLRKPPETVHLRVNLVKIPPRIMQKIVIKVLCTGLFQLLVKYCIPVFLAFQKIRVQFRCNRVSVPRIPVGKCLFYRIFAAEPAVHPCRIKVGKSPFEENINHFLCLLNVNTRLIVFVQKRQTHKSES